MYIHKTETKVCKITPKASICTLIISLLFQVLYLPSLPHLLYNPLYYFTNLCGYCAGPEVTVVSRQMYLFSKNLNS